MAKVSRESAPDATDHGPAEDRGAQLDGYAVIFTSIREDWDLAPLLKGSPGDSCHCPHWGYVTAGRLTVRYGDREEVIEPGDAFYLPPGHVPAAVAGTELVMFSPQDELAASEAAMREAMQLMMQKGKVWSPRRIEPATPSLPWNHREPMCEPSFPQLGSDRKAEVIGSPSTQLCAHSRRPSSEQYAS